MRTAYGHRDVGVPELARIEDELLECERRRARAGQGDGGVSVAVNDVHSALNATEVARVAEPDSVAAVQEEVVRARAEGAELAIAGGRHAMGGQQFGAGGVLLDMPRPEPRSSTSTPSAASSRSRPGSSGPGSCATWRASRASEPSAWGIAQKQTGADRLTIGGALSANVHGRGLAMPPIIGDVESFDPGRAPTASPAAARRTENAELFALVDRRLRAVRGDRLRRAAPAPRGRRSSASSR